MRFVDDQSLSLCLTVSTGIQRDTLLSILGKKEVLAAPQVFDDFIWEARPLDKGMLNVLEDGDFLITLENDGFMGVRNTTVTRIAAITGEELGHYVAVYRSSFNRGYLKYVEIQDGLVLANFTPVRLRRAPEVVDQFFPDPRAVTMANMISALEYRMEIQVKSSWLEDKADTYIIDYND